MSYVDPEGTDANMVQDGIHTYLEVGQPDEPITRLELGPAQTSTFDLIMNRPVEGEVSVTNMTGTKFTPNKSTIKLTAKQDLAIINRTKELKKKFFTGQRKYQWSPNTGSNCRSFDEELLEGSK